MLLVSKAITLGFIFVGDQVELAMPLKMARHIKKPQPETSWGFDTKGYRTRFLT